MPRFKPPHRGRRRTALAGLAGAAAVSVVITACTGTIQGGSSPGVSATEGSSTWSFSAQHPFITTAQWNYDTGDNPLVSNGVLDWYQSGMVDPPLAWNSGLHPNEVTPGVADRWQMQGKALDIWVTPGLKWSNGTPVTANDMAVSLEIAMYLDQWMGEAVGPIRVLNSQEVQVEPGSISPPSWETLVLGLTPVYSAAEFGHFIPKNVYQEFLLSQQSTKAGIAASTRLGDVLQAMEAYKPNYSVSCGPWEIDSVTSAQALFKPNPYWRGGKDVPWVELLNYSTPNQIYGWAAASAFTISQIPSVTPALVSQFSRGADHKVQPSIAWGRVGLSINTSVYPYNQLKVRQALAYLINRDDVAKVALPVNGTPVHAPVGIFDSVNISQNLTAAQQAQLNPYSYNPAKGEQLLESAGFKKTGSGWVMGNGQPFAPVIYANNLTADQEQAAEAVAAELQQVGIQAKTTFLASNLYNSELEESGSKGMDIAVGWEAFSQQPYNSIVDALDYTAGLNLLWATKTYTVTGGDRGLPPMEMPNGSPINVPEVAVNGLYTTNQSLLNKTMFTLSQAFDYSVPMIPLYDEGEDINFIDDQYYTGFPQFSSSWWTIQNNLGPDWAAWFYLGMIKPAQS